MTTLRSSATPPISTPALAEVDLQPLARLRFRTGASPTPPQPAPAGPDYRALNHAQADAHALLLHQHIGVASENRSRRQSESPSSFFDRDGYAHRRQSPCARQCVRPRQVSPLTVQQ
jgi:hypothetical protein